MPLSQLDPYWQTRDEATVRLYHGDALEVLERLPSSSVHCAVTSPPYWGLRDYGTGTWEGGDNPDCKHQMSTLESTEKSKATSTVRGSKDTIHMAQVYLSVCKRCGARRVDQQLGMECHPDLYVSRLVEVFRELRRVLRDDGLFWIDIGDTFGPKGDWKRSGMVGIPHRLAFALQDDGWILAMEHIHSKPAPMTESVTNRCTKSHNYVFMFAKKTGYFFDQFAIREKSTPNVKTITGKQGSLGQATGSGRKPTGNGVVGSVMVTGDTRNKRSVWTVANSGYKGAHFATFSESLILPCIKAGTSEKGCCTECGAPWKRVVERTRTPTRPGENSKITDVNGTRLNGEVTGNRDPERHVTSLRHLGWYPSCKCYGLSSLPPTPSASESSYAEWVKQARELCLLAEENHSGDFGPCVVLDPFIGSGTTSVVCMGLGRYSMGIDLSEEYLKRNAIPRIEGELLGRPALASLVPR
jgi:DNA modification methylase